jgi:hypothetical protein
VHAELALLTCPLGSCVLQALLQEIMGLALYASQTLPPGQLRRVVLYSYKVEQPIICPPTALSS